MADRTEDPNDNPIYRYIESMYVAEGPGVRSRPVVAERRRTPSFPLWLKIAAGSGALAITLLPGIFPVGMPLRPIERDFAQRSTALEAAGVVSAVRERPPPAPAAPVLAASTRAAAAGKPRWRRPAAIVRARTLTLAAKPDVGGAGEAGAAVLAKPAAVNAGEPIRRRAAMRLAGDGRQPAMRTEQRAGESVNEGDDPPAAQNGARDAALDAILTLRLR